ncbi:hypothetical protein [Shivajiella indica]|uniref:Uncharacterized protein n=1 Tax=Shivajiella indica TaxID=872115 RepID=A0ABW5B9I3_9BACT
MRFLIFLCLFSFCLSLSSQGQSDNTLEKKYRSNIPFDQEIVSGGYFVDPPKEFEGHPYFETKNFESGQITINGLTYSEVPLLYNIWKDEVLTFQPIHKQKILIRADKIDGFTIFFNTPTNFIRLTENPGYSNHGNGIYELVIKGKANLLIKHRKQTKSKREISKFSDEFYEQADFFIEKEKKIIQITSKKQAFEFLQLDKKKLRNPIRQRGLDFRRDKRSFLSYLTTVFNQESL